MHLFPDLTAGKGLPPPAQILQLKFNVVFINQTIVITAPPLLLGFPLPPKSFLSTPLALCTLNPYGIFTSIPHTCPICYNPKMHHTGLPGIRPTHASS
jgi:hypothetical protein